MPKFRKLPIVVEARLFATVVFEEQCVLADWCHGKLRGTALEGRKRVIQIYTLEGEIEATFGDWIIRGVKGEFYPCKPDIFALTYEKVDE